MSGATPELHVHPVVIPDGKHRLLTQRRHILRPLGPVLHRREITSRHGGRNPHRHLVKSLDKQVGYRSTGVLVKFVERNDNISVAEFTDSLHLLVDRAESSLPV
jgi:hypothetical protein